jgi:ubiquitin thioesterase protein OTUB1
MRSFEDLMKMAGVNYELLEDFFDQTWELFKALSEALMKGMPAMPLVIDAFNDEGRSNAIVYHFKMMTSSYMAMHPDGYEPFLEMPLDHYRQARIDPTNQEIDQIGLQALSDGVIAPAGFAVEVLYLDRSAGDEVTPHEFISGGDQERTIRLLYRP